jgi:ADP-ribose pyrophosphatase
VTNDTATTPSEDGSPLERGASVVHLPLDELLAACRSGAIEDSKTELALRRFAEGP